MPRYAFLWVVLAGAFAGLGQAPLSLPWMTLVGLGVAYYAHACVGSTRQAAWIGWGFGLGYFAVTLHWIVEPFLVDPVRHGWMAPFALVLMAGGAALFWALAVGIARRLSFTDWSRVGAWVICLAGAELLRSYVFTGFPWALIGHVWVGWAPMQWAAWIGPHGLTVLTLAVAGISVQAWTMRSYRIGVVVLVTSVVIYGVGLGHSAFPDMGENRPIVRLVQPNAPQHLKWHPDHVLTYFERQVTFTAAVADVRPDLVIWPETSVPWRLSRAQPALDRIASAARGVPVLLGVQHFDEQDAFNSLAVMDRDGQIADIYDKHHLVPFGEYIPAMGFLSKLPFGALVEEHGFGYTPGPGARVLDLGVLGKALPLICYEAIFPHDVNAAAQRPDWLVQITNDAWFGNWVGPYQHLAQARLRAVEQGLPMVRVANTGVSAVIDAKGHVLAQLPLNEAGFLDHPLPPPLRETIYARTGDWPATVLYLMYVLGLVLLGRRKHH